MNALLFLVFIKGTIIIGKQQKKLRPSTTFVLWTRGKKANISLNKRLF